MVEKPDTASAVASLVDVEEGCALPPDVPVFAVDLAVAAVPVPVLVPVVSAPEAVGRLANNAEEVNVLQLDDAGIRAVYGIVVIGPRDSAG